MLTQLRLTNFKAFEDFRARCGRTTFLSGPNNAGKTTVLAALRAAAQMQRIALSRVADDEAEEDGGSVPTWTFAADQVLLNVENLRHEFRDADSRIRVSFSNGARLRASWPATGEVIPSEGYFYFLGQGGVRLSRPAEVRREVPGIGFVPLLTPLEQEERELRSETVRANFDTRRASRNFRNQLHLLAGTSAGTGRSRLDDYLDFIDPWVPELELKNVAPRIGSDGMYLDLFYLEEGSAVQKEIYWAGDGMQIWLQVLLHLFRLQDEETIVLDEPDVYLHADLQRRLVRLLESLDAQTITATHSSEVVGEAAPSSIFWVSKNRRDVVGANDSSELAELSAEIGSQFNIRLARAFKARVVLFVEGQDLKTLTHLARTVGAERFATEAGLAAVPLQGFSNWEHVEPFAWFADDLLEGTVPVFVVLDRDYRPQSAVQAVLDRLNNAGIRGHVWDRKELESYLLVPTAISRASGAPLDQIEKLLEAESDVMQPFVSARLLDDRLRHEVSAHRHAVDVTEDFNREFPVEWSDLATRLGMCPPKKLLSALNRGLVAAGSSSVSRDSLSRGLTQSEIASEMREVLLEIEGFLA